MRPRLNPLAFYNASKQSMKIVMFTIFITPSCEKSQCCTLLANNNFLHSFC